MKVGKFMRPLRIVRQRDEVVVRALLDRPDSRAMGLHPVVLELGSELRVTGLAEGQRRLERHELDLLLKDGHGLEVELPLAVGVVGPLCAAWIGQAFANAAEDASAPALPFERREMTKVPGQGWFLLDTPATVFGGLDRWIRKTFAATVDRGSSELAKLLSWVAPDRDEARAARFVTGTAEQQRRALNWWIRLERDAGRPPPTEDDLIQRIDQVCERTFLEWRGADGPYAARLQGPWQQVALAARCAERLAPAVDPAPEEPEHSPVARAIGIAREAAVRGRPALHKETEPVRIALLEQVHHRWQEARMSAHLHPYALHAVESALFGAERALEDTHLDQAILSMHHGLAEIIYPDLTWRFMPALWRHFETIPRAAVESDREWLAMHHDEENRVSPAFFDRDLWPRGTPPAWEEHVERFRYRLFSARSESDAVDVSHLDT